MRTPESKILDRAGMRAERDRLKAAGRSLVFDSVDAPAVLVNPASLAQILATLIENSLKYGAGTTTVRSKKAGRGVVIEVADEGPGVPDDLTEAIFRKGVSTGGSTGIGLPLARSLAETDGGRLDLTSARPPVFTLALAAVPQSLDPGRILPTGSMMVDLLSLRKSAKNMWIFHRSKMIKTHTLTTMQWNSSL